MAGVKCIISITLQISHINSFFNILDFIVNVWNNFVDWLIHWLIGWLIHWLIDCLIARLIDWLIDWLFDWLIGRLSDLFIYLFIVWFIVWFFDGLIGRLSDWLIDWLIDWFWRIWLPLPPVFAVRPRGDGPVRGATHLLRRVSRMSHWDARDRDMPSRKPPCDAMSCPGKHMWEHWWRELRRPRSMLCRRYAMCWEEGASWKTSCVHNCPLHLVVKAKI